MASFTFPITLNKRKYWRIVDAAKLMGKSYVSIYQKMIAKEVGSSLSDIPILNKSDIVIINDSFREPLAKSKLDKLFPN